MYRWLVALAVMAFASAAAANYTHEDWNNAPPANNDWAYWDTDYIGVSGDPADHNRPMTYHATGGVAGTGCVSVPIANMEPAASEHTTTAYWPAYPGEPFYVPQPFPAIDLSIPGAAVRVAINHVHGLGMPLYLGAQGKVRFFIGYYDSKLIADPDDDEQAFFCTTASFAVGDNTWSTSTVTLGGNSDWQVIVRDEPTKPVPTQPTDLYLNPQQWGFCIWPIALNEVPSGGGLRFDNFDLVPEPASLAMLAAALAAACSPRRHRHRRRRA